MRIGVHFVDFTLPGAPASLAATLGATASAAEEVGCSWFSLMDHWFQMEQQSSSYDPMLEGYTSLGFLAGRTERIQLGLVVTGVTYRYPGLLAKTVTTVDVLSQGRAFLGLGAAWYAREHRGLGVPFPPVAERFERLEETVQICRQMWSPDDGPFHGKHYQLEETICSPQPLRSPRIPLVIGGRGRTKTLRLVARYADACNLFTAGGVDEVRDLLDVLDRHCEAEGRDPAQITRTIMGGDPVGDPEGFVADMQRYAALGVSHVQVTPRAPDPVEWVLRLRDVVPRLAEIGGADRSPWY